MLLQVNVDVSALQWMVRGQSLPYDAVCMHRVQSSVSMLPPSNVSMEFKKTKANHKTALTSHPEAEDRNMLDMLVISDIRCLNKRRQGR